jgi:hypothetical protein
MRLQEIDSLLWVKAGTFAERQLLWGLVCQAFLLGGARGQVRTIFCMA